MSGADLEYQRMLREAGVNPKAPAGYDASILEQIAHSVGVEFLSTQDYSGLRVIVGPGPLPDPVDFPNTIYIILPS